MTAQQPRRRPLARCDDGVAAAATWRLVFRKVAAPPGSTRVLAKSCIGTEDDFCQTKLWTAMQVAELDLRTDWVRTIAHAHAPEDA